MTSTTKAERVVSLNMRRSKARAHATAAAIWASISAVVVGWSSPQYSTVFA